MILAFAAALLVSGTGQQSVRDQVDARMEADRQALANITFPGFDISDDAVDAAAIHYCGKTDECRSSFLESRNRFIRSAAIERRQKQALKILIAASDDTAADWRVAETLYDAKYHPTAEPYRPRITATCRATNSGKSIYSTCSVY